MAVDDRALFDSLLGSKPLAVGGQLLEDLFRHGVLQVEDGLSTLEEDAEPVPIDDTAVLWAVFCFAGKRVAIGWAPVLLLLPRAGRTDRIVAGHREPGTGSLLNRPQERPGEPA